MVCCSDVSRDLLFGSIDQGDVQFLGYKMILVSMLILLTTIATETKAN